MSSGVHGVSDQFVADYAALDPISATQLGISGHDDALTDFSPDGHRARYELATRALRDIAAAAPADDAERAAKAVFQERIGLSAELHEAGLDEGKLNVIESPVQAVREIFDLMPTDTPEQWAVIAKRLAKVPDAVANLR